LRREGGLTLGEFGARAGFSSAYLSREEQGQVALSVAGLARLSEVFALPVAALLDEPASPVPYVVNRAGETTAELRRMEGDVFEMEDHRNRIHASFKIYCTPLASCMT
jgi:transcriptional regulator with XRE-family HTH domain